MPLEATGLQIKQLGKHHEQPVDTGQVWLTISDLKQFGYCPRIVYYQHRMAGIGKATFKMEEGRAAQAEIERLELRRTLRRYGLSEARRRFGVWLKSERYRLTGRIDLLLESDEEVSVVEFKLTETEPQKNHLLQLCGYGIMAEDVFQKRARRAFFYRIPDERVFEVELTDSLRQEVLKIVEEMRLSIVMGWLPEATEVRRRCEQCEYVNFCADVW